jgi:glycosyltransferase involved in cell wall biosynthesis
MVSKKSIAAVAVEATLAKSPHSPHSSVHLSRPGKLKVALVGPMAPYDSGIAQYTSELHQGLMQIAEVHSFSFKHMYPGWLYPGKTGYKLDPDMKREPGVVYSLNIYNPLSWRSTADRIVAAGCEIAILDWWTLIMQPEYTLLARRLRKRGVTVLYLCHNLFNHKTGGYMGAVDTILGGASKWMLQQADGYIVQSSEKKAQLLALKPDAKVMFRLHPIYDRFPDAVKHMPKRGRIELLFFGLIRPYKGVDILIEALKRLQDRQVYLTIAGELWGDKVAAMKQQIADAGLVANIETHFEHVSDADTAEYFDRADVVVTPYRSATGSGPATIAFNYGKPVLAARVGGLGEAVLDGKTGWLVPPESPDDLARVIAGLNRESAVAMRPAIAAFCKENSWEAMARAICDFGDDVRSAQQAARAAKARPAPRPRAS